MDAVSAGCYGSQLPTGAPPPPFPPSSQQPRTATRGAQRLPLASKQGCLWCTLELSGDQGESTGPQPTLLPPSTQEKPQ